MVTHHSNQHDERWEQPGETWTHDDWLMAYCWLCEAEGLWDAPAKVRQR